MKNDLPIEFISEAIELKPDGALIWRERPLHHFPSASYWMAWNSRYAGRAAGSPNSDGHIKVQFTYDGRKRFVFAHRIAWALHEGSWPDFQIDHRDRSPANNCRSNLRKATATQNGYNKGPMKNNTSGFKGVSRNGDRWMASIRINGKKVNLGRFNTPLEASEAYKTAAERYHGDFFCS